MPKSTVTLPRAPDALDLVSRGRAGPPGSVRLRVSDVEQIRRTVRRVPEVVVKVSGGARDMGGAAAHLRYIDRHGKLALVTDDGRELAGKGIAQEIVADWNLDLSPGQYRSPPAAGQADRRPKLTYHIVLSMPARTPPDAVLQAACKFAREAFALQHRYALVLHTDQGHPHVHLVVKAEREFEPGERLHITKPLLRRWREDFAACLREQGVAANATPSSLRGRSRGHLKDPIYRRLKALQAHARLAPEARDRRRPPVGSSFMRERIRSILVASRACSPGEEKGRQQLIASRQAVHAQWQHWVAALRAQGEPALAEEVQRFIASWPPVRTDQERLAEGLRAARAEGRHSRGGVPSAPKRGARDA